jgi:signal transduction histidine kinase
VKYLGLAQIECRFNGPEPIPANHLSAEVRRNLFLVVKEALHNVVKHSGAAEATMTVHIGEGTVEITIKDNGKGFLIGKDAGSGNGLGNMKNRMNDIGGSFSIESSPGHGTQIHIAAKVYTLGGDQSGRPAVFSDQPDRPS